MAGIYIHIPFCKSRCDYCAFYSTTLGDAVRRRYVERLCREIAFRKDYLGTREVSSIYIGGGTPSRLSVEELNKIFEAIKREFCIMPDAEITMEVNPDDITEEYAKSLHSLPVNRISMGLQSFNDRLLKAVGRRHTAAGAVNSYNILRRAGFGNISLDLIYAFPDETLEEWESDVGKMVALRPQHISAYALSYEEGTPLYKKLMAGAVSETDEELYIKMYASLMNKLKDAGYEHYEISNFAIPGMRAKHNSSYWSGGKYLGIGAGAHSYDGESRRYNVPDVMGYIKADDNDVPHENEKLSAAAKYDETVMTRLRTREGINLGEIKSRFGEDMYIYLMNSALLYLKTAKLIVDKTPQGECLKLLPAGIFISDEIISDLMNPE